MIPDKWIQVVITDERSSGRFEEFANRLVSRIEGQPIVGTSRTYDLSVDGKNLRLGRNVRVFVTIESRIAKVQSDAAGFVEHHTGPLDGLYIVSARATTEDTLQAHREIVEKVLAAEGLRPQIVALGAHSIAELVSNGYAEDDFRALYEGDVATVSKWSFHVDSDVSHERMRLALSTAGVQDARAIRDGVSQTLVLQSISKRPKKLSEIHADILHRFRSECIATSQLAVVLGAMHEGKLLELQGPNYAITAAGERQLAELDQSGGRALLEGKRRIRVATETSLGYELTPSQWQRTWDRLTTELCGLLQAKGQELIDVVNALATRGAQKEDRESLLQLLQGVIERVAKAAAEEPQRPTLERALSDALLPGAPDGAFEWLTAVVANYAVICTMGLSSEVYGIIASALKTIRFLLDTDVVISYLLAHEPSHDAATAIKALGQRLSKPAVVPTAVVEESARHATKSYVDYDVQVEGRTPLAWFELYELKSAFTREFERLRLDGKIQPENWLRFIERYAGRRRRGADGKLQPDVARMREILVREGFEILGRLDLTLFPKEIRNRLGDMIYQRIRTLRHDEFDEIRREKARLDAELLLQVSQAMAQALEKGDPERYVLVTSASVLRHLPSSALDLLDYKPEVVTLGEAAVIATLLPDSPLPLRALQALLFDGAASEISGLGQRMMAMLRKAIGDGMHGASRGVMHMELRSRIIEESKGTPLTPAEVEKKALRDPTLFAKLVAAAVDTHALERKVDKQEILDRIKQIAKDVGLEVDD